MGECVCFIGGGGVHEGRGEKLKHNSVVSRNESVGSEKEGGLKEEGAANSLNNLFIDCSK